MCQFDPSFSFVTFSWDFTVETVRETFVCFRECIHVCRHLSRYLGFIILLIECADVRCCIVGIWRNWVIL